MREIMQVATWNLRYSSTEHTSRRVNFLTSIPWDIIALQEVSQRAWDVISNSGLAEYSFYTLDGFGIKPSGKRPHGVALLARNGFQLSIPQLIPNLPKIERALAATIIRGDLRVTVASWHAPNAAGEGVKVKMQGYRGITDWLNIIQGPIILGFDSNHWNRSTNLKISYVPASSDQWLLENQFFGDNALHRLRDTFLEYLQQQPLEYNEIVKQRPHGPLAVSYIRGSAKKPVEDRFDYIFVSDEIGVTSCSHDYSGAKAAGSDHGIVIATLKM